MGLILQYKLYALMRAVGLKSLYLWWEQRKLDRARIARFEAFCKRIGAKKINGKWVKEKELL